MLRAPQLLRASLMLARSQLLRGRCCSSARATDATARATAPPSRRRSRSRTTRTVQQAPDAVAAPAPPPPAAPAAAAPPPPQQQAAAAQEPPPQPQQQQLLQPTFGRPQPPLPHHRAHHIVRTLHVPVEQVLVPPIPAPQIQQQQQPIQQHMIQQQPSPLASIPPVLAVSARVVVESVKEFAGEFFVLKAKTVLECSNAVFAQADGWRPKNEGAAFEALAGTTGRRTSSSGSGTDSREAPGFWAMRQHRRALSITGSFVGVRKGVAYAVRGAWQHNPRWGWGIRAVTYEEDLEASDPQEFLQQLPNIGAKRAAEMVAAFGPSLASIRDVLGSASAVAQLARLPSITRSVAAGIKEAWDEEAGVLEQQRQLEQQLQLAPRLCTALLKQHSNAGAVVEQLRGNPYCFFRQVPGFTLQDADRIAQLLGFPATAPERGAAYLQQQLLGAAQCATGMPWRQLQLQAAAAMQTPRLDLRPAAGLLLQARAIVIEQSRQEQSGRVVFEQVQSGWREDGFVSLRELHDAETAVVDFFVAASRASLAAVQDLEQHKRRSDSSSSSSSSSDSSSDSSSSGGSLVPLLRALQGSLTQTTDELERLLSLDLDKPVAFNDGQRVALAAAMCLPVLAVTGGPGCGKTLTTQAFARCLTSRRSQQLVEPLFMAAPTGRAAQRLQELVPEGARAAKSSTIHRLLGYRRNAPATTATAGAPHQAAADAAAAEAAGPDLSIGSVCTFNASNPLPQSNFLVDEVSMMDVVLAAALFSALRTPEPRAHPGGALLLVGDTDQLPPVGPGLPIAAALAEGMLPCIDLRQIYRSAANSAIVTSAHAINQGRQPQFTVWDLQPDSTAGLQLQLTRHMAAVQAPDGSLELPSNALLLRLPDHVDEADVADALMAAASTLLPAMTRDMQSDVQVLSPIKGSAVGVHCLNARLQPLLNPPRPGSQEVRSALPPSQEEQLRRLGVAPPVWRVGDRVTHLKNDAPADVFNGDQGYIEQVDAEKQLVVVRYPPRGWQGQGAAGDGSDSDMYSSAIWGLASDSGDDDDEDDGEFHRVTYSVAGIREQLQLAWATTVHKAQGGEYPIVLAALHRCVGQLLRRPLLYTAVSRAQQQLIVVATQQAVDAAVRNQDRGGAEASRLQLKMRAAREAAGLPVWERAVFGPRGWE